MHHGRRGQGLWSFLQGLVEGSKRACTPELRRSESTASSGGGTLGGQRSNRGFQGGMPRAKGQRVHLTSFRRRGRDESRQRAPPGTEFCDFAWGDLVYENVRFSFTEPPLNIENG